MGTPTEQIARLFLVPPATMAARLTRAKKKIVLAGIPLGAPLEDELRARLDEVCRTIYLAFTAGYTPGDGPDLLRADLAGDAVRLAAVLHDLVPDGPQVRATFALVVLHHSRRDARQRDGRLVPLADQDRSRWHQDEVRAGLALVDGLGATDGYAEELRLQALIAAEHARAPIAAATDWIVIARHYATLEARTGSAVVRLNRAVAVAEAEGPEAGLTLLAGLGDLLHDDHRVAAVRADLARRAGDLDLARASYREAIDRCANDVERTHLRTRLASAPPTRLLTGVGAGRGAGPPHLVVAVAHHVDHVAVGGAHEEPSQAPRLFGERVDDLVPPPLRLLVRLVDVGADVHRDDRVVRRRGVVRDELDGGVAVGRWCSARPTPC